AKSGIDDEVHVFMKDSAVHVLIIALSGNSDPILVVTGLEISGYEVIGLAVASKRLEGFECRIALKDNHVRRYRRGELHVQEQQSEGFAEFFEPCTNLSDIFFRCIPDQIEVLGPHLQPFVLRKGRTRSKEQYGCKKNRKDGETWAFH